jgi:anti-sigma regulatory factor (Ser/Thr protein kinase)
MDPAEDQLIMLDARSTMSAFISDGEIDRDAFHAVIGGLLRKAGASGGLIHAYGEMVALLWDAGDVIAALELECLWNELARELRFSLFCAYPAASVTAPEHADALHRVCHLHSAVVGDSAASTGGARHIGDSDSSADILAACFPAERESPGAARRLLVDTLRLRGCERRAVETAALLLSELASNAVRHASSSFSVEAKIEDAILRVAVEDGGALSTGMLVVRPTRGLGVIDALARHWGVEATPTGKVVWAELAM